MLHRPILGTLSTFARHWRVLRWPLVVAVMVLEGVERGSITMDPSGAAHLRLRCPVLQPQGWCTRCCTGYGNGIAMS